VGFLATYRAAKTGLTQTLARPAGHNAAGTPAKWRSTLRQF
jgi:hypothetical protein